MKTEALPLPAVRTRFTDFLALTKPRLNFLVVVTTASAYYLGAGGAAGLVHIAHTVLGTALVAGGAAALNQFLERDVDAAMPRTRLRPLPDGRVQPAEALWFGILLAAAGLVQLALGANLLAAGLALATLVLYVLVYTPLKRRTHLATLAGAIPGALPTLIGWTAARGAVHLEAWVLFAILFFWQLPHFLAIGWMYRDDYRRAGLPLLAVVEPDGHSTARQVLAYTAVLVPVSLLPTLLGLAGPGYFAGAFLLGCALFTLAARFATGRTTARARALFAGSIGYLPLLLGLMIGSRLVS